MTRADQRRAAKEAKERVKKAEKAARLQTQNVSHQTNYERRQRDDPAFGNLEAARRHNHDLVGSLIKSGKISTATAMAIRQRFSKHHQALRMTAHQALAAMGDPNEGETPWDLLTEEQVLAEDAARAATAADAQELGTSVGEGEGEGEGEAGGKGKRKAEEVGEEEYDSDWSSGPLAIRTKEQ
ncbi:hypothetical protein MMC13_002763 [Lambiella insularis]|nr:hypothetical protein [Lambiella insularis]